MILDKWMPVSDESAKDGECTLLYAPPSIEDDWPGITDWCYWDAAAGHDFKGAWVMFNEGKDESSRPPWIYTHWLRPSKPDITGIPNAYNRPKD